MTSQSMAQLVWAHLLAMANMVVLVMVSRIKHYCTCAILTGKKDPYSCVTMKKVPTLAYQSQNLPPTWSKASLQVGENWSTQGTTMSRVELSRVLRHSNPIHFLFYIVCISGSVGLKLKCVIRKVVPDINSRLKSLNVLCNTFISRCIL